MLAEFSQSFWKIRRDRSTVQETSNVTVENK